MPSSSLAGEWIARRALLRHRALVITVRPVERRGVANARARAGEIAVRPVEARRASAAPTGNLRAATRDSAARKLPVGAEKARGLLRGRGRDGGKSERKKCLDHRFHSPALCPL
jgi:hypothetical protein